MLFYIHKTRHRIIIFNQKVRHFSGWVHLKGIQKTLKALKLNDLGAFSLKDFKICAESKDEQFTVLHMKHHLLGISDETGVLEILGLLKASPPPASETIIRGGE